MALPLSLLFMMRPALVDLGRMQPQARVLGLGYPDVLDTRDALCTLFGEEIRKRLIVRDDAKAVAKWHGLPHEDVVETRSLFAALGLQLDCVDMRPGHGVDRVVDLNENLPDDLAGRYQMIIDPGTIEHCFNIGQAMINITRALSVGGYAVHVNPMTMINHGFYNLNPTFYSDFYGDNGFQIGFMTGLAPKIRPDAFFNTDPMQRMKGVPEDSVMMVIAQRVADRPIVWPVQSKYRKAATSAA